MLFVTTVFYPCSQAEEAYPQDQAIADAMGEGEVACGGM